jgi:hypothetical protein
MAELRARVHNILESGCCTNNWRARCVTGGEPGGDSHKKPAERKRNDREFKLAQETQKSLLPRSLPSIERFHIRAFNSPTRFVGGDFYDFLQLSSGQWMGVVGCFR